MMPKFFEIKLNEHGKFSSLSQTHSSSYGIDVILLRENNLIALYTADFGLRRIACMSIFLFLSVGNCIAYLFLVLSSSRQLYNLRIL